MSKASSVPKILIFTGFYEPAEKAGGPVRSVANIVSMLKNKFSFYIITSDRDLGDNAPFDSVSTNEWVKKDKVHIYYAEKKTLSYNLPNIFKVVDFDLIYLNSYFSYNFTTIPLIYWLSGKIKRIPVLLAPRGEFSKGALGLKYLKKHLYIDLLKLFGVNNKIILHATTEIEKKDIQSVLGKRNKIFIAPNMVAIKRKASMIDLPLKKTTGKLKICFISRVVPKKNLSYALDILLKYQYNGNIVFDIYGPIEDEKYWDQCKALILQMPPNISVQYLGSIKPGEVNDVFVNYHLFFFPTKGENFGHIIAESLISGCPPLLSDQVPWGNIEEEGVGWCCPLKNKIQFYNIINGLLSLGLSDYMPIRQKCINYIDDFLKSQGGCQQTENMFNNGINFYDK